MNNLKFGFPFLAATVLAMACGGCAPVPYCYEPVVVVLVPCPDRYPPPVIVVSTPTPSKRPLEKHQGELAIATKTRQVQPSPTRGKPRVETARDERIPVRATTSGLDDERSAGTGKTRKR